MCGEMALKTRDFAACRNRGWYMYVEAERLHTAHRDEMSGLGNRDWMESVGSDIAFPLMLMLCFFLIFIS
jgi:hypothetical protein